MFLSNLFLIIPDNKRKDNLNVEVFKFKFRSLSDFSDLYNTDSALTDYTDIKSVNAFVKDKFSNLGMSVRLHPGFFAPITQNNPS